jgi:hypothetical protein
MDKLQTRRFSDRLVDVTARRPAGFVGRLIYRRAPGHEASFVQVMKWLGPVEGDRCLELGCGGGILLGRALSAGASRARRCSRCRGSAIQRR